MEWIYGSIYFFPPHKASSVNLVQCLMTLGSLDLFREGVHTRTTNSDSLCSNTYFSILSKKHSIQPILNTYLGKSFVRKCLFFSTDHAMASPDEDVYMVDTNISYNMLLRINLTPQFATPCESWITKSYKPNKCQIYIAPFQWRYLPLIV